MVENIYADNGSIFDVLSALSRNKDGVLTIDSTARYHEREGQVPGIDMPFSALTGAYIEKLRSMASFNLGQQIEIRKREPIEGEEHITRFDVWVSGVKKK